MLGTEGAIMSGGIESVVEAGQTALVADAAASELRPPGRGEPDGACGNCGTPLQGPHCYICGQVADDLHRPFWALAKDALDGLFALDGRVLRTVPALLFQPGRVTKMYLDGARARYVPPFRLFLISAVVFLLAVSMVTGDWTDIEFNPPANEETLADVEQDLADAAERAAAEGDPAAEGLAQASEGVAAARRAAETAPVDEITRAQERTEMKCAVRRELLPEELGSCPPAAPDAPKRPGGFGPDVDPETREATFSMPAEWGEWPISVRRFLTHQFEVVIDDPSRFLESVNRWISRVLIALFPVYALLLGLMHLWKRRFFYFDHVIVSLHFHSFLFLMLTILIAASALGVSIWLLGAAFFLWSNLYVYRVHRRVYGSGRFSAVTRALVLDFLYLVVLSFTPVVLAIGGFLTA